jgi:hypothetical protein
LISRAGARGDVDERARAAAVLGAESRVVHLELLDVVDERLDGDEVDEQVVEVDAVYLEVDRILAVAGSVIR